MMRRIYDDGGIIANTILQQLGGAGQLRAMTGAYNFVDLGNGLSFRIKNQRANFVKITLTSMDLYDVEVGRIRGGQYKVVKSAEGLYADQLKPFIEKATGMYLSLFADGGFVKVMKDFEEGVDELRYKVDADEMSIEVDSTTKDYLTNLGIVPERFFRKLRNTFIFWYDDLSAPELEELEDFLEDTFYLKNDGRDEYGSGGTTQAVNMTLARSMSHGGDINNKTKNMNYSFFLFTQLYNEIIGVQYEYDQLFQDLQVLYNQYENSSFNDANEPEYECMVSFLEYHKDSIKKNAMKEKLFKRGGKVKKNRVRFVDKVESIADRLEGTKVPKRLKKDYGGRYNREEAEEAGRRIAGAQLRDKKIR